MNINLDISQHKYASLLTLVDSVRGTTTPKQSLAKVRPLFEAAAALLPPDGRIGRPFKLLEEGAFRTSSRGLPLPVELCDIIASHMAPEAATNVELAFFAAFYPGLQQTVLREVHAAVMLQDKPATLSWRRYLNELAQLQLPHNDEECVYRVFAGTYPAALAGARLWQNPALRPIVLTQQLSAEDKNESSMHSFFAWGGRGGLACSHTMLRDHDRFIFINSSANRHKQGWSDSPFGTPNQIAFTFAPAGKLFLTLPHCRLAGSRPIGSHTSTETARHFSRPSSATC